MNLDLDDRVRAFRDEARAWPHEHVPSVPLPGMDTAEGFEAHREWEAALAALAWASPDGHRHPDGSGVRAASAGAAGAARETS